MLLEKHPIPSNHYTTQCTYLFDTNLKNSFKLSPLNHFLLHAHIQGGENNDQPFKQMSHSNRGMSQMRYENDTWFSLVVIGTQATNCLNCSNTSQNPTVHRLLTSYKELILKVISNLFTIVSQAGYLLICPLIWWDNPTDFLHMTNWTVIRVAIYY